MIVIRSGRQPHEVFLSGVFALASVAGLSDPLAFSGTVLSKIPLVSLYIFYAVLVVGSTLNLIGVFVRGLKGPVVEAFGLGVAAIILIGYGGAIFGHFGSNGLFFGLVTIGVGSANVWRIFQIRRELRRVRQGAVVTGTVSQLGGDR